MGLLRRKGMYDLTDMMTQFVMNQLGFGPLGEIRMVTPGSGAFYNYMRDRVIEANFHKTVIAAEAAMVSGRNDVLLVSPDSNSLAASLTWDNNLCHMLGAGPDGCMNMRTRIGMSTTFTPMITVSGYGNKFKNIYTMHGTAIGDLVGWLISGERNVFENVHFGGPMNAAQGGATGYIGVHVTGSENVFRKCVFGTDTIGRDETTPNVKLGPGTLTTFEDCLFLANLTDGDPVFVNVDNTSGYTWARFKKCQFMAFNSNYATAMTVALSFNGGSSAALVFDNDCQFQNLSLIHI